MTPLDLDGIEKAAKHLRELANADVILELVRRANLLDQREREITQCHVLLNTVTDPAALNLDASLLDKLKTYLEYEDSLNNGNG